MAKNSEEYGDEEEKPQCLGDNCKRTPIYGEKWCYRHFYNKKRGMYAERKEAKRRKYEKRS